MNGQSMPPQVEGVTNSRSALASPPLTGPFVTAVALVKSKLRGRLLHPPSGQRLQIRSHPATTRRDREQALP
jgi:hypothetical protein